MLRYILVLLVAIIAMSSAQWGQFFFFAGIFILSFQLMQNCLNGNFSGYGPYGGYGGGYPGMYGGYGMRPYGMYGGYGMGMYRPGLLGMLIGK